MLDLKFIRSEPEKVRAGLKKRHYDESLLDKFLETDKIWRAKTTELDAVRQKLKLISKEIGKSQTTKVNDRDISAPPMKKYPEHLDEAKNLSSSKKALEEAIKVSEDELGKIILEFPNLPDESVPVGKSSEDNREIRKWGQLPKIEKPRPHWEIGTALGIFDFERAAKISGGRFVCLKGSGARLERALIDFMVDLHVKCGYTEVMPPALVNAKSMEGTGQLPKFDNELYKCRDKNNGEAFADDDYYLIPTAEVCVTNLHREEILKKEDLPINYVAYTPCFRREAGSYGKETKGLIRVHQFNKVELVKFCEPQKSPEELETLLKNAELVLQKLNLPYRVVELCTADLGFGSAKTYDLEVWFPSAGGYKEISSCSNFTGFQARRAQIRYRSDPKAKPEFVHTLNGSGLAVGRTMAAILENFQQPDGKVKIPDVLVPYMGDRKFIE